MLTGKRWDGAEGGADSMLLGNSTTILFLLDRVDTIGIALGGTGLFGVSVETGSTTMFVCQIFLCNS